MDLEPGIYVGFRYSKKSEMEAFNKVMSMVEGRGISLDSISLDKYYSTRKVMKLFNKEVAVYVTPRKNISRLNLDWARVIRRIAEEPIKFLKRYFMRNLSGQASLLIEGDLDGG